MRLLIGGVILITLTAGCSFIRQSSRTSSGVTTARPSSGSEDPFVGRFRRDLGGEEMRITKEGSVYRLSGEWSDHRFVRRSRTMLRDQKAEIGTLTLWSLESVDGRRSHRVVVADLRDEQFVLVATPDAGAR